MLGGYVDVGQNTLAFDSMNNFLCFNFNVDYQLCLWPFEEVLWCRKYCNSCHFDGIELSGVQS